MTERQLKFIINESGSFEVNNSKKKKSLLSPESNLLPPEPKRWPTAEEFRAALACEEPLPPIKGGVRIPRGGHWVPNIGGPGRSYVYPRMK